MTNLAVVGSLNMDLVVRTRRLPYPGETLLGRDWSQVPGGKGANQAVAAARLGANVSMVGRVGEDDFGRRLRENLRREGVSTEHVRTEAGASTGVALIQVEDSGQNTIVVVPGTNGRVSRQDVDEARAVIHTAQALIAQLEIPLPTVRHALEVAQAAGVLTVLNPAPAEPLTPEFLALADLVVPNETEASLLTGIPVQDWESAEHAAAALHRMGARRVVITLGAGGALWSQEGQVERIPAYAVQALDATAAGDAFVGALTVACAARWDMRTALREASAAGALAATRPGAQPSLPTRHELAAFLETR